MLDFHVYLFYVAFDFICKVLTHEKKKIRKSSVIVQPAIPNNSSSVPRNISESAGSRSRNKEIVALAAIKTEENEKPPVDSGYGKDVKGLLQTLL